MTACPPALPLRTQVSGFTLIELLVALSIMALMTVIAWRGLDGMQAATRQTRVSSDEVLTLEAGVGQWAADLDAMTAPSTLPNAPIPMDWDGQVMRITRRHPTAAQEGLVVVAWTLGKRDGVDQWLRWQSVPLRQRQDWRAAWELASQWAHSPSNAAMHQELAITALDAWQIYYFRGGAWSNPLSSSGTAAAPATAASGTGASNGASATATAAAAAALAASLPDGVRLVLKVRAPHPLSGTLTRDWARPTLTGNAQ